MDNNDVDNFQSVLSVLPDLVWKDILDKIEDSRVTENVLHAFPELSVLFHKMKPVWFFDQILPHLNKNGSPTKKVTFNQSCQYVCKRWASVVENFQQNHPSNRAYDHEGITRRSVSYREFSYDAIPPSCINFYSAQQLLNFCDAMKNHPRDPFRGRDVTLSNWETPNVDEFLDAALVFLQPFGKHIKSISLSTYCGLQNVESSKRILFKILKCLSHLRNGHYLSLTFRLDLSDITAADLEGVLPQFLHFDTVEIFGDFPMSVHRLLMNMFAPIKKLITCSPFPMECLCLRNLVELDYSGEWNMSAITRFPKLKKLTVRKFGPGSPKFDVSYLFSHLESLELEELKLPFSPFRDGGYSATKIPQFPTIKYLHVTDHPDQSLNFLKAFPSLEHLKMNWASFMSGFGNEEQPRTNNYRFTWKGALSLTSTLRYYLYEPVVPSTVDIWNELPSLKLLTVVVYGSLNFKVRFAKECGNKPFYSYISRDRD